MAEIDGCLFLSALVYVKETEHDEKYVFKISLTSKGFYRIFTPNRSLRLRPKWKVIKILHGHLFLLALVYIEEAEKWRLKIRCQCISKNEEPRKNFHLELYTRKIPFTSLTSWNISVLLSDILLLNEFEITSFASRRSRDVRRGFIFLWERGKKRSRRSWYIFIPR